MDEIIKNKIIAAKENFASSFSRIWKHVNGNEKSVGILTAFREEFDLPANRKRNQSLKANIKNNGYGFFNVGGFYIQNYKSPEAKHVEEESIFVVGRKDNGLKKDLFEWGKNYDQDCILFKPFNKEVVLLIGTKPEVWPGLGKEEVVGRWQPNKIDEFYTKLKGKPFVFASAELEQSGMSRAYMNMNMRKLNVIR